MRRRSRTPRPLASAPVAAAALAVITAAALTACAADDGEADQGGTTPPSSSTVAVTSSSAVPGPDGGTVELPEPVAERWAELGGEEGDLGRASGPATNVAGGSVADFERGTIVLTPAGRAFVVQGAILEAYREAGGPEGELGFPTSDETTTDGGWVSAFENGSIAYVDGRPVVETR